MFSCRVCNKEYDKQFNLSMHISKGHKINIIDYKIRFGIMNAEDFNCKKCKAEIVPNKYGYCEGCYQKSSERKTVSKKIVNNRPTYDGKNNPNYRGKTEFLCICGEHFFRRVSPCQEGTRSHTYCSRECKKKYSVSKTKYFEYKGLIFRSSYELAFAQYLDNNGHTWKYEPEAFKTSYGFYTPDFWVNDFNCYFEVKGFFRKDAEQKFNEFSKTHTIILANKEYLLSLGFIRIKSGPRKNQLCPPAVQP